MGPLIPYHFPNLAILIEPSVGARSTSQKKTVAAMLGGALHRLQSTIWSNA